MPVKRILSNLRGADRRVGIVLSRFNPEIGEGLLAGALRALREAGVRDDDIVVIDAAAGVLDVEVDDGEWAARPVAQPAHQASNEVGFGRELFGVFRAAAAPAEQGASVFGPLAGEAPLVPAAAPQPAHHGHETQHQGA